MPQPTVHWWNDLSAHVADHYKRQATVMCSIIVQITASGDLVAVPGEIMSCIPYPTMRIDPLARGSFSKAQAETLLLIDFMQLYTILFYKQLCSLIKSQVVYFSKESLDLMLVNGSLIF